MPAHDIIDNRNEKLVDHIQAILPQADKAKFAVGYFFLSGLEALGENLDAISELRLLIGNTSNRQTIEQLSEAYKRLDIAMQAAEDIRFAKKADQRLRAQETQANLKETIEVMDQTDDGQKLVHAMVRMIEEERLKVRIYTKGRLHAKAYIFDFAQPNPGAEGIAIIGSSNLTLSGIRDNTELNVLVHDKGSTLHKGEGNHARLTEWFDELWEEAQDFEPHLMDELKQSWAATLATPYDIYMKTLFTLVRDRIEGGEEAEILWDDDITRALADFQKVAVRQAIQMIRDNGGCFVADVVGLGKSYIGAAIVKQFERAEHARPLIICPKPLEDMWVRYNELYHLNAQILPMSQLQAGPGRGVELLSDLRYRDRDFILIDESHNFRHHSSQRYQELQSFLATGRKVCLLTATPRNSQALDVYNQIKLFHPEDTTYLPIDPPDLKQYFRLIDKGERRLRDLLSNVLIRRRRRDILRWYGYAEDTGRPMRELTDQECASYLNGGKRAYVIVSGKHNFFPRRELDTLRYSIEDTYAGLYQQLRGFLGKPKGPKGKPRPSQEITYARYGIWHYVRKDKQKVAPYKDLHRAGINLRGIIRTSLFKRFESSVYAFRLSLDRMIRTHGAFLKALDQGFVPAGEKADDLLGRSGMMDDDDLLDALGAASGKYPIADFDTELLKEHIAADRALLNKMKALVEPISPEKDDKLQTLQKQLRKKPVAGNKCLIFTQYADTAIYLFENLNPGAARKDIEVIYGTEKSKSRVVGRFAPKANPQFAPAKKSEEIGLLVATDVLAEGLNMQDCSVVLNYDLHWNPVRLIQRFGRIDRIGSEHETIWGINFLPETGLEKNLGLQAVLQHRIQEIHESIGEDAAILDESEQLNEGAMYAIYEKKADQLSSIEQDTDEFMDLNEAEEIFRNLAANDPEEYERIKNLRDGIRSRKRGLGQGLFVMCQAGRYSQLFLVDENANIRSRDIPRVLEAIRATPDSPTSGNLPGSYNHDVMRIKNTFIEEVKHRKAQRVHALSLTQGQRYVLRELRAIYAQLDDKEDLKGQLNVLEKAFRISPTAAIKKELNFLRRNGVTGKALLKTLTDLYLQHRISERIDQETGRMEKEEIPRIICSEALFE